MSLCRVDTPQAYDFEVDWNMVVFFFHVQFVLDILLNTCKGRKDGKPNGADIMGSMFVL